MRDLTRRSCHLEYGAFPAVAVGLHAEFRERLGVCCSKGAVQYDVFVNTFVMADGDLFERGGIQYT